MKILILGGNGYLGWPTAIKMAELGHQVSVVDNNFKLDAFDKMSRQALFSEHNLQKRCELVQEYFGFEIKCYNFDICDYTKLSDLVSGMQPDCIVHYAEQPSAPYSMLSYSTSKETLNNNLISTFNVLWVIKEYAPDCHLVKLGTMGEYGTPNIDIEEGWLDVRHNGREQKFLFPRQAGSLYHTSKILDTDLIWFYVRNDALRVTDLMQGPVYGFTMDSTQGRSDLYTHFAYDDVFGTVVNRFIAQAVLGVPLTIYGAGEQTRGYLNIVDTIRCVRLAIENRPEPGKLEIFNQFTETLSVNDIADRIIDAAGTLSIHTTRKNIINPRKELENHYYNPKHSGLINLGLEPTLMSSEILSEMITEISKYKDKIRQADIMPKIKW